MVGPKVPESVKTLRQFAKPREHGGIARFGRKAEVARRRRHAAGRNHPDKDFEITEIGHECVLLFPIWS